MPRLPTSLLTPLSLVCLIAACRSASEPHLPARLVSPLATVDFGRRSADAPATVRAISIQNVGGTTSLPLDAYVDGAGKAGFTVYMQGSTCPGRALAPGESCIVVVALDGPASGPLAAYLHVVETSAEGTATDVRLTGTIASQLAVHRQGTGHGWVAESVHNTSCVPECGFTFDVARVTLTAVADPESYFAGWIGVPGCDLDVSCTLELIDLNAVTVRFEPLTP